MISADEFFEIDGTGRKYAPEIDSMTTEIRCSARIGPDTEEKVYTEVNVYNGTGNALGGTTLELAAADVDAYTPTGNNSTEDFYNQIEQAVKEYLEDLPANSAVTFTLN